MQECYAKRYTLQERFKAEAKFSEEDALRLFIKASVQGTQIGDLESIMGIFAREQFMYETVFKKMRQFQIQKSVKSNIWDLVPRLGHLY